MDSQEGGLAPALLLFAESCYICGKLLHIRKVVAYAESCYIPPSPSMLS